MRLFTSSRFGPTACDVTQTFSPRARGGTLLALVSASLYGLNIGYARLASFAGVSGTTVVVYRVLLMLALLAGAAALLRRTLAVEPEERLTIGLLGVTTALIAICYLSAVSFIPVTVAVVLFYTFPILILLASPFVEGTRLTPPLLGTAALALVGVVLVVGPAFKDLDWRGVVLALGASVSTTVQFFAAARCRRTGVVAKVFWIHVVILPTACLIGIVAGDLAPPSALALAPFPVAMTISMYLLGVVLQFLALGRIPAVAAGIVYCTEPVVASLGSAFILGESLNSIQLLGGTLVLSAIMANLLLEQRAPRAKPLVALD
jgi:drug/metabolite transporter (DMT)-like permease